MTWENRLRGGIPLDDYQHIVRVNVDGMDVTVQEPQPFDPKWMSHKHRCAALRYEIGVSTSSGEIVSIYGPFPAGQYNDQAIYNLKMRNSLEQDEKVLADQGYSGPIIVHGRLAGDEDGRRAGRLRAYHENVNGRIKSFGCTKNRWRHPLHRHNFCFFAVCKIVNLMIVRTVQ